MARPRVRPAVTAGLAGAAAATLAVTTAGMRAGIEPFATWYYPFAWYSTLVVFEAAVAHGDGRFPFLDRPRFALSLFGWSIPFWLVFELFNFRLANWYYVFVPDAPAARWSGIALSFATVLPAIFLAERVLRSYGPWREGPALSAEDDEPEDAPHVPRVLHPPHAGPRLSARHLATLQLLGLVCLLLPLAWPRLFFPLVWVGVTLVADPWVYRRDPGRSLLADLERGRGRRMARLLFGGMVIGLFWELYNVGARGKWIYTVPGLEELKLFEMPLLGFFGFPFLALEGWSAYQALALAGVAVDPEPRAVPRHRHRQVRPGWTAAVAVLAGLFAALVLRGMETGTISSTTPRLEDLEGAAAAPLRETGLDPFELAEAGPGEVADRTGTSPDRARDWIEEAHLLTLRGIGPENAERLRAVDVSSVAELAREEPARLAARLEAAGLGVSEARVRVWVRAAVRAVQSSS